MSMSSVRDFGAQSCQNVFDLRIFDHDVVTSGAFGTTGSYWAFPSLCCRLALHSWADAHKTKLHLFLAFQLMRPWHSLAVDEELICAQEGHNLRPALPRHLRFANFSLSKRPPSCHIQCTVPPFRLFHSLSPSILSGALVRAASPLGMSANFRPIFGESSPGNLKYSGTM